MRPSIEGYGLFPRGRWQTIAVSPGPCTSARLALVLDDPARVRQCLCQGSRSAYGEVEEDFRHALLQNL